MLKYNCTLAALNQMFVFYAEDKNAPEEPNAQQEFWEDELNGGHEVGIDQVPVHPSFYADDENVPEKPNVQQQQILPAVSSGYHPSFFSQKGSMI